MKNYFIYLNNNTYQKQAIDFREIYPYYAAHCKIPEKSELIAIIVTSKNNEHLKTGVYAHDLKNIGIVGNRELENELLKKWELDAKEYMFHHINKLWNTSFKNVCNTLKNTVYKQAHENAYMYRINNNVEMSEYISHIYSIPEVFTKPIFE